MPKVEQKLVALTVRYDEQQQPVSVAGDLSLEKLAEEGWALVSVSGLGVMATTHERNSMFAAVGVLERPAPEGSKMSVATRPW